MRLREPVEPEAAQARLSSAAGRPRLTQLLLELMPAHALVAPPMDARPGEVGPRRTTASPPAPRPTTSRHNFSARCGRSAMSSNIEVASSKRWPLRMSVTRMRRRRFSGRLLRKSVQPRNPKNAHEAGPRRNARQVGHDPLWHETRRVLRPLKRSTRRSSAARRPGRQNSTAARPTISASASTSLDRFESPAASVVEETHQAPTNGLGRAAARRNQSDQVAVSEAKWHFARDRHVAALDRVVNLLFVRLFGLAVGWSRSWPSPPSRLRRLGAVWRGDSRFVALPS